MRTKKFTVKRALGLTVASALALAGSVAVADSSQAAVSAVRLNKSAISENGGTVVTVTGKDFETAGGTAKVGTVWIAPGSASSACDTADIGTSDATAMSIVSSTKLVFTSPSVVATTAGTVSPYVVCLSNAANDEVVGYAKVKTYPTPSVSAVSTTSGPTYGGTSVTITGDDFTSKTTATIGGNALTKTKVVIDKTGSSDTITGLVPAGSGATEAIVVSNEGGDVTAVATFAYSDAISVSPAYGPVAGGVVEVSGTGFASLDFDTVANFADTKSAIVLIDTVGGAYTTATTDAAVVAAAPSACGSVQVVSDSLLTCVMPAVTAGTYTVQLLTGGATNVAMATVVSRDAVYTAAAF